MSDSEYLSMQVATSFLYTSLVSQLKPLPRPPATTARLSLGNSAASIATAEQLRFQLDHALARDAVHTALDAHPLLEGLAARGLPSILLHSAATDRKTYLRRPDLGRTLHPDSVAALQSAIESPPKSGAPHLASEMGETQKLTPPRIAILLADGLSALALERHALPLLDALLPYSLLPFPLSPVLVNARVALGDPIGELLQADLTVLFIGERPGLSAADSLGVYITWNPRIGCTDAERNCISNIRGDAGLAYTEAAHRIAHYIVEARRLGTTGTMLKDPPPIPSLRG